MIKWGPTKGKLAGMCNLLGGHVERGEDVLASAVREAAEESGLSEAVLAKNAQLAGVVHVRDFFGTVRRQPYSSCSDVVCFWPLMKTRARISSAVIRG